MDITGVLRVQCHPDREFLRLKKDSYEFEKEMLVQCLMPTFGMILHILDAALVAHGQI